MFITVDLDNTSKFDFDRLREVMNEQDSTSSEAETHLNETIKILDTRTGTLDFNLSHLDVHCKITLQSMARCKRDSKRFSKLETKKHLNAVIRTIKKSY